MNDWIKWHGETDFPPLSKGQSVDVQHRAGTKAVGIWADSVRWVHFGTPGDIVAYRLSGPRIPEDMTAWKGTADTSDYPTVCTLVEVMFRDGTRATDMVGDFIWEWSAPHCHSDIVAYKIIEPASGPATPSIDDMLAERGKQYGKFTSHAELTQRLKYIMKKAPQWAGMDDDQKEALEMIAHKIGRILNGNPHYFDSWKDIAGYARLVADRLENGTER